MKTNVLKIVLPMAVVALGLVSAASTSSLNNKDVAQMGYKRIVNPNSCVAVQQCDDIQGFACKAPDGVTQLYAPAATCLTPLKRSTPN